jgi:hypothetical protein
VAYNPNPPPYDRGSGPGYPPYDRGSGPGYPPYDRGSGPGYPPQDYGSGPGYGYSPYPAREHPDGTTILVLGILSLVACGLLGPFAWVKGNRALAEIDRNPAAYTNRSTVQAGRICGIVATCILVAVIVSYALFAIAIAVGTASS